MMHSDQAREESAPANQSLARGLCVLELLANGASFGFLQLKRATGLSSATLTRILHTLMHEGWISRRLVDGQYRLSVKASNKNAMNLARTHLAEIAAVSLRQMHRSVLWPSDISICDGSKMIILESNRGGSPLMINRQVMDKFPRMLWSATGRIYLAACPPAERARILANLRLSAEVDDSKVQDMAWVKKIMTATRKQGYGERAPDYPSPDQMFLGQLSAIAVPIYAGNRVVACLSLIWVLSMATQKQIVESHLGLLHKTAGTIGAAFARHSFIKPLWLDSRYAGDPAQTADARPLGA